MSRRKENYKDTINQKEENAQYRKEFGERLKRFRENYKLTQEEIAEILEITPNYYGKIERGENNLTLERLAKLKESQPVDLNYLVAGQEPANDLVATILEMDQEELIETLRRIYEYQIEIIRRK